jgi:hypothetical protein
MCHVLVVLLFFYFSLYVFLSLLRLKFCLAHLKDVARRAKHQFRTGLSKPLPKKA